MSVCGAAAGAPRRAVACGAIWRGCSSVNGSSGIAKAGNSMDIAADGPLQRPRMTHGTGVVSAACMGQSTCVVDASCDASCVA